MKFNLNGKWKPKFEYGLNWLPLLGKGRKSCISHGSGTAIDMKCGNLNPMIFAYPILAILTEHGDEINYKINDKEFPMIKSANQTTPFTHLLANFSFWDCRLLGCNYCSFSIFSVSYYFYFFWLNNGVGCWALCCGSCLGCPFISSGSSLSL